jgi:arginase
MKAGLVNQLKNLGWEVVVDPNNLLTYEHLKPAPSEHNLDELNSVPPPLKNVRYTSAVAKDVMKQVSSTCANGSLALTIGGDHSLGMGTIAGSISVYPNLGVIWVDAHADINTPETTTSGNLHGMPLSFVMGIASNKSFDEWLPTYKLHPSRLVYIGLRDVDPGEKEILKQYNIKAFSMHEVDKYGIGKIMDMTLEYLGRDSPIHLSFDVDALDPSVCPSTGTPVRGGLTFREGHYINEVLAESGCLVAVDIMEVNPILGDSNASDSTVSVGLSLTRSALGETLL